MLLRTSVGCGIMTALASLRFVYVHFYHFFDYKSALGEALDPLNQIAMIVVFFFGAGTLISLVLAGLGYLTVLYDRKHPLPDSDGALSRNDGAMNQLAFHRPLWFAASAACLILAWDIFWFFTFIDMQRPQEELVDMAIRLGVIYGMIEAPIFLIGYGLGLCAIILSVVGRGFRVAHYSAFSRIFALLLCIGCFWFHRFYLWRLILIVHAARHPDPLGY